MAAARKRDPRKKPTQRRSQETVDAIVVAATRILEDKGYEGTNVNRVAELAGVSIGSLYQYFPTKEALVAEVGRRLSSEMIAVFMKGFDAELALLPLREAARGVVGASLRAFRVNPKLRAAILHELPQEIFVSPDFDATLKEMLRQYFEFHRDRVRPRNLELAVAILFAAVEASCTAAAEREDDEDEVIDELTELVCGYLEPR